jgi:hypothetical protein
LPRPPTGSPISALARDRGAEVIASIADVESDKRSSGLPPLGVPALPFAALNTSPRQQTRGLLRVPAMPKPRVICRFG